MLRKSPRLLKLALTLALLLMVPFVTDAGTLVDQGAGSVGQQPWKFVLVPGLTSVSTNGSVTAGAPTFNVSVSTASAAATGLGTNTCYRVSCSTTVAFRTGTGTPTALTTDGDVFGPAVEKLCLVGTATAIAFITPTGTGTCKGILLP